MAIDTQDLNIDNIFTKSLPHSLHNVITAVLDTFLIVVPCLDAAVTIKSAKLLPPGEHAMEDVPFPRCKVPSPSLGQLIYIGVIDGVESGIVLRNIEGQDPSASGLELSNSPTRSWSMQESGSQSTAIWS